MPTQNKRQKELNARKFSLLLHHHIEVINHDNFPCMKSEIT